MSAVPTEGRGRGVILYLSLSKRPNVTSRTPESKILTPITKIIYQISGMTL